MSLKQIDFSKGIRSENIQYNFEYLQNGINTDRLFTVGSGISEGLEITVDKANYIIHVDDGSIVDDTGELVPIKGLDYTISLTNDILQTVYKDYIVTNGRVTLIDTPYAKDGKNIAILDTNVHDYYDDISIQSILGTDITDFVAISPNVLQINNIADNSLVNVKYHIAKDIIYTIYIATDYSVQICKSISSTSPSEYQLSDFLYKLGNVFVNTNMNGYTTIQFIADMNDRINLYTNSNNELYICGKKFDDLCHVYITKPSEPLVGDLWYNSDIGQNRIYVYKEIDGELEWVPLGDYVFSAITTKKYWNPEDEASYIADYLDSQYFIFSAAEQDMFYEPNVNALSVMIDNTVLHQDQYSEVKLSDIVTILETNTNPALVSLLRNLGYTENFVNSLLYEVDLDGNIIKDKADVCVGFKTLQSYKYNFGQQGFMRGPYIEATVSHLLNIPSQTYKVQKTTSFVHEDHFIYDPDIHGNNVFSTKYTYKVNEHQIEVFVNGIRLINKLDYIESEDIDAITSGSFKILNKLNEGDTVSYKINAVCYSYDNDFCNDIPKGTYNFIIDCQYDESDMIKIPNEFSVDVQDYINVYTASDKKILIRSGADVPDSFADYELVRDGDSSYIKLLNPILVPIKQSLYVTGIKFSRLPK